MEYAPSQHGRSIRPIPKDFTSCQGFTQRLALPSIQMCNSVSVSFTVMFIICRVFTIPYFWLMTREENWIAEISPVPRFWQLAAPAALDLLNIYWGQKIYSKLVRAFKRIEKEL